MRLDKPSIKCYCSCNIIITIYLHLAKSLFQFAFYCISGIVIFKRNYDFIIYCFFTVNNTTNVKNAGYKKCGN